MTTNRRGLEQALSDERLDELAVEDDLYNYPPTHAELNGMARELLAYRRASKEPVAYIDELELNRIKDGDSGVIRTPIYGAGYQDASIPLYAAPPLQAVTVPDGWKLVPIDPTENMVIAGFESKPDESFSEPEEWEAYEAMSGCQQAAHKAKLCWAAMLAAVPKLQAERAAMLSGDSESKK